MESNEDKKKPQINDEVIKAVNELISAFESEYNINIFFACDTGSRALGVAVESSDLDVNCFFIPHYREYMKIIRKSPDVISKQGMKIKAGERELDVDLQIWDIKDWLKDKVMKNTLGCDFYFSSPVIYRNFHPEIIKSITDLIDPPFYYFWGKYLNCMEKCEKAAKGEGCQNKHIMNTLIYATQYLHCITGNVFPNFNIFIEIDTIREQKEDLINNHKITPEEFEVIEKCLNFIIECYEEKKKGRKSLTKEIPDFTKKFLKILNTKFNAKPKWVNTQGHYNAENAQEIFNQLLSIYKK
jgi:hypothetical protein